MNTTANRTVAIIIVLALMLGEWWVLTRPASDMSNSMTDTSATGLSTSTVTDTGTQTNTQTPTGQTSPTVQTSPTSQATTMSSGTTVSVINQPAGDNVKLSMVTVEKPTWVAVVDTNDKILGARRFDTTQANGDVVLLRPTKAGASYQLYMYVDNGDKTFDAHKDSLVTDASGQPASLTFTAQ